MGNLASIFILNIVLLEPKWKSPLVIASLSHILYLFFTLFISLFRTWSQWEFQQWLHWERCQIIKPQYFWKYLLKAIQKGAMGEKLNEVILPYFKAQERKKKERKKTCSFSSLNAASCTAWRKYFRKSENWNPALWLCSVWYQCQV